MRLINTLLILLLIALSVALSFVVYDAMIEDFHWHIKPSGYKSESHYLRNQPLTYR